MAYLKDPALLRAEVAALPKNRWVVIDEIQKVPSLLDEVHALMENDGYKYFILTGSSARKLKRGAANLLAGRARLKKMFSLNANETNFSIPGHQMATYGMLPLSITSETDIDREEFLESYVETYLNEEIKHEGLVRNLGSFARFLEVSVLSAGSQINMSGLARDAGISRDTVRGYFSVFEDTLMGTWLPAYRPRAKVKEVVSPKFYWFDPGVLNAAAGAFRQPMPSDWSGVLLEHLVHHEISSYLAYSGTKGTLGFWRTPSKTEIDFVWWYGDTVVAIEVKSSKKFRKDFLKGINSFAQNTPLRSSFVVYRGNKELKIENTWILPLEKFLQKLYQGEIISL